MQHVYRADLSRPELSFAITLIANALSMEKAAKHGDDRIVLDTLATTQKNAADAIVFLVNEQGPNAPEELLVKLARLGCFAVEDAR